MISDATVAFLEGGQSIYVGTCDASLKPAGARAIAVVVDPDRRHVAAYLPDCAAARLMGDLQATRRVAIAFARPTDHRACQLKGTFVSAAPATEAERPLVHRQWELFQQSLEAIGIGRALMATWKHWPCVAIRVQVTETFSQTPGPGAGAPLS